MARFFSQSFGFSKDRIAGLAGAALIHGLLFLGSGFAFVQAPQYGVQASIGGVEVNLVAALPAETKQKPAPSEDKINPDSDITKKIEKPSAHPKVVSKQPDKKDEKSSAVVNKTPYQGDGSARNPGQSPTTFFSAGGGSTAERKGFLKNPPPPYPQEAINRGQEGLVILLVHVDRTGHVQNAEIETSSNSEWLDDSALKTVKRWKFDPAYMGTLPVDATIKIPIRFVLKDALEAGKNQAG